MKKRNQAVRLISLISVLIMVLSFCGCKAGNDISVYDKHNTTEESKSQKEDVSEKQKNTGDKKKSTGDKKKSTGGYKEFYSACKGCWVELDSLCLFDTNTLNFDYVLFENDKVTFGYFPGESRTADIIDVKKISAGKYELDLYYPELYDFGDHYEAERKTEVISLTDDTMFFASSSENRYTRISDTLSDTISEINTEYYFNLIGAEFEETTKNSNSGGYVEDFTEPEEDTEDSNSEYVENFTEPKWVKDANAKIRDSEEYKEFELGNRGYWVALERMITKRDGTKIFDYVRFKDGKMITGTCPGVENVGVVVGFELKGSMGSRLQIYYPEINRRGYLCEEETKTVDIGYSNRTIYFESEPNKDYWYIADTLEDTKTKLIKGDYD